jgi:hypothetical protein
MKRSVVLVVTLIALLVGAVLPGVAQTSSELQAYFSQNAGLNQDEIASIRNGQPVAKALNSRNPDEIFLFGAVYINATPESYVKFSTDFSRLRKIPEYLAIEGFSAPPRLSDLKGFEFDADDIKALKNCKSGDCQIQLPASTMEELQKSVNWSAPDAAHQVNQFIQNLALQRLLTYQKEGNRILGAIYNDKSEPTNVADEFKYILTYGKALPKYLPEFYNYLLSYPDGKPANVQDTFYWDNVKFGLKPTLRIVQVVTLHGSTPEEPVCAIAEKQLYSSHYFEAALDLTFCIRPSDAPKQPGFYLIRISGSEQAGLTGFKGSIIRRAAVSRSVKSLKDSLTAIKSVLENK